MVLELHSTCALLPTAVSVTVYITMTVNLNFDVVGNQTSNVKYKTVCARLLKK